MRGLHQCLVAEIHYTLDPIPNGTTPGTSDNLAQRNILLDESDNPGSFATHLVQHTFELKPSVVTAGTPPAGPQVAEPVDHGHGHEHGHGAPPPSPLAAMAGVPRPDRLMVEWGNLPRDAHATFYLPTVDTEMLLQVAGMRQAPANLARAGTSTIHCRVTDVGFLPISAASQAIPGLLTLQLPPNLTNGQKFSIVLRQIQGRTNRIIGTFQFDVLVKTKAQIVPGMKRDYSVLRYIGDSIPGTNRWYPVWQRYLEQFGDRLRAFGEDPEKIAPTPTGDGERPGEGPSPEPGEPGGPGEPTPSGPQDCFTGKVDTVHYDCFGDFEGFTVRDCEQARRFRSRERTLEELIRRLCCERKPITVCYDRRHPERPVRILVRC